MSSLSYFKIPKPIIWFSTCRRSPSIAEEKTYDDNDDDDDESENNYDDFDDDNIGDADDVKPARIDESSSLGVDLLSLLHCVQKHFACNDDDDNDDDDYDDDYDDDDDLIICFPVST